MSPGLSFSVHLWRGVGPDREPDLFVWRWRFGLLTVSLDRMSLLARFRELQALVDEYTRRSMEGR